MNTPANHIEVFKLEKVDSTQSYIRQKIASGVSMPCAVIAAEQTHGRGRGTHVWNSPPGGFYTSLACQIQLPVEQVTQLSLRVGQYLQNFLREHFHIKCWLKWPNDLYYGSKKIAGILCQTATHPENGFYIIVGIGINCKNYSLPDSATSIEAIRQDISDSIKYFIEYHHDFYHGLLARLCMPLSEISFDTFLKDQPGFWYQTNHLPLPKPWQAIDIDTSGAMYLASSGQQKLIHETTGWNHSLVEPLRECIYAFIDIGNSSVKIHTVDVHKDLQCQLVSKQVISNEDFTEASLAESLKSVNVIFYCSVKPILSELLEEYAKSQQIVLSAYRGHRQKTWCRDSQAFFGLDRILLVESQACGEDVVVIGAGTALTVDALTRDGEHLGGWVLPGMHTARASLIQSTAGVRFDAMQLHSELGFAYNTQQAVDFGQLAYMRGIIQQAVELFQTVCQRQPKVTITGGDAKMAQNLADRVVEDAVIQGLMRVTGLSDRIELNDTEIS